jgi:hypothetical protein
MKDGRPRWDSNPQPADQKSAASHRLSCLQRHSLAQRLSWLSSAACSDSSSLTPPLTETLPPATLPALEHDVRRAAPALSATLAPARRSAAGSITDLHERVPGAHGIDVVPVALGHRGDVAPSSSAAGEARYAATSPSAGWTRVDTHPAEGCHEAQPGGGLRRRARIAVFCGSGYRCDAIRSIVTRPGDGRTAAHMAPMDRLDAI